MRVRGFLEIASALYETSLPNVGARLKMTLAAAPRPKKGVSISFATGGTLILEQVARKKVDVGWVNPATGLAMAVRGKGIFKEPLPLKTLALFPSWDRMAFAVAEETGLNSLADIREKQYPLRVSVSGATPFRDNLLLFSALEVLRAGGLSLEQIRAWGGSVQSVVRPSAPERITGIENGSLNAVLDEGLKSWGKTALAHGMKFLQLDEPVLAHMESLGYRRGVLSKDHFPGVRDEITTLDFSGWPVYCHADMPEAVAYSVCEAIALRKDSIPVDQDAPLEMAQLCNDSGDCPMVAPLHPGAERYYRERGYLV
jgi:hypothetical protein